MKQSLVYLIEATVYTECGLLRLVGSGQSPTSEELEEALAAWPRVFRRRGIPFAEVLSAVGGWPAIVAGVEKWRRANCLAWNIFVEAAMVRKLSRVSRKHRWCPLVKKYGKTPQALTNFFHLSIEKMADEILAGAGIFQKNTVKRQ